MFYCEIREIFKNIYFEEHLRTTASKHRSSFLEVFCRSCCSALMLWWNITFPHYIAFPQKYGRVQSWRVLHANLQKIALHHRYLPRYFATGAEQRYWKMHLDGWFWGRIYFENIPAWLLLKGSCKQIFTHILHFLLWRHVKEFPFILVEQEHREPGKTCF